MPRTIRWKLILSISVPLLVTYLGMLGWDYYRQRSAAMEQMQKEVLDRAESTAANLDARLSGVMQLASATASGIENRPNLNAVLLRGVLIAALRQNPWVSSIVVTSELGSAPTAPSLIVRRGGGGGGAGGGGGGGGFQRVVDFTITTDAQRAWYNRVKSTREAAWSAPYEEPRGANETTSQRVATYAVPVMSGEQFLGVVAVSIAVDELRQRRPRMGRSFARPPRETREFTGEPGAPPPGRDDRRPTSRPSDEFRLPAPPPSGNAPSDDTDSVLPAAATKELDDFGIFDAAGRPVVTPAGRPVPQETIFETAQSGGQPEVADAARDALAGHSHVVRVTSLRNVLPTVAADDAHWLAFAPIAATDWALVSVIPESTVMGPILKRIGQRAIFLAVGSLVLLTVVLLVSIRISRPIERLAGAVDRLAAGDMDVQVIGIRSRDEIGRLADGFNHMTRQLKSHVAALTEQTAAREKVDSELRIARQIQTDMLPKTFPPFPERPEFDLHAINLPARRVAGDFYDFFFTPAGALTMVIADVSGKGVPAALLMAVTRTIVRNLAMEGLAPREIAQRTNTMLIADTSGAMFVTMLLAQYDPTRGRLTYVNAGHPPPYRISPGTMPRRCCDMLSPLLGVDATGVMGPFEQCEEMLAAGESLLAYTDGVIEARSPYGQSFGERGLAEALRTRSDLAPSALCGALAEHVARFQMGPAQDDITLLALRRSAINR